MPREIRIGGAAGYWGDSPEAARQLVLSGDIDYLIGDYLAEVTMSILVRMKQRDPQSGYARDFVTLVMTPLLKEIHARKIRVVVNAGGINVAACASALATVARQADVPIGIASVTGDDVMPLIDQLRAEEIREMFSGAALPETVISANAYLGAFPIAAALDRGADVVITGRCADSALTLGPLMHEFRWGAADLDRLAAGSLAGHILECGAQATGGNFTDWSDVADGWDNVGYPIAVCRADGTFDITKPPGTGGRVSRLSVGEQILYETGDPRAYVLPDVVCDFSETTLEEMSGEVVRVSGVRGRPPTDSYKVSATYGDGWRATALTGITGFDAPAKAQAYGAALIRRTERLFSERQLPPYHGVAHHVIGNETLWPSTDGSDRSFGPGVGSREVVLQTEARHPEREALEIFSKEVTGVALSMSTGRFSVGEAGRPKVTPVVAQFAFLLKKSRVDIAVAVDGSDIGYSAPPVAFGASETLQQPVHQPHRGPCIDIPLINLAVARSGDKGDSANIGLMARSEALWPVLRDAVSSDLVARWFSHICDGPVSRYEAPGFHAVNFVLMNALGGGGTASLHLDKQAKAYGQILLAMPVPVPSDLARSLAQSGEFQ